MPIALITDFGTRDAYVGVMKGVVATLCPGVQTIDITHDLPPQDVAAARFTLLCAYPYLPLGTVYLVVVDPGVGTSRRAIALQTQRGYLVGPDNGVLSGVLDSELVLSAVELTDTNHWRVPQPSATFHGRDIFAPAAAHLAQGVPLARLGSPVDAKTLVRLPIAPAIATARGWHGTVQHIDHFGNAATTIAASAVASGGWTIAVGKARLPLVCAYGEVDPGQGLAVVGSHGWVEVAVNQGSAATRFGLAIGSPIEVSAGPPSA